MDPRNDLQRIARASIESVDARALVAGSIRIDGKLLRLEAQGSQAILDLARFQRVFVLGFGKAAGPMAQAVEAVLGPRIDDGLIVVKPGREARLDRVRQLQGAHPVPDQTSVRAAGEVAALADRAEEGTLVITLISGGGSALVAAPLDCTASSLTLDDIQETTRQLLACGATIAQLNCIRKHLLLLGGGRLAQRIAPASCLSLVLSDVVGNDLQTIASGPTCPDSTTFGQALSIIDEIGIGARLPKSVVDFLREGASGKVPETPKPGAAELSVVTNVLVGSNLLALRGAAREAGRMGYHAIILTSHLQGEARDAAGVIAAMARDVALNGLPVSRPACLLTGGETTVTVRGNGKGGRNQEMALAFLREMEKDPEALSATYFLSFSTDGEDGPTEAAGGFAFPSFAASARAAGLRIADSLHRNDSHTFLKKLDGLLVTGPTTTNVCDVSVTLVV